MTIRQLLRHTSGIPDYYETIEEVYRSPTNRQALAFLSREAYLDFQPGSRYEYSNSGYDLLGTLIEAVSKQKFADFMEDKIFAPAGMTNTFTFSAKRRRSSDRAIGYAEHRGTLYVDDTSPLNKLHGSGSIYSSIDDLVIYDAALFGGRLISTESLASMFEEGRLRNGRSIGYGLGWEILTEDDTDRLYYGHSGAWMGFSSYYLHYPDTGVSVIVVSNHADTDAEALALDTASLFE